MPSLSPFIEMSGPFAEVRKSALINDYENIIAYSEESEQSKLQANKCSLCQIHLGYLRVNATSRKLGSFYSHLSLEIVFPTLNLAQNCYININMGSPLFLLQSCSLSPTIILCLKDYPHNPPFPTVKWIGNNLEVQPMLMLKKNKKQT